MTRSLTTAVKNHLATNEIRPVHLITIGFATPQNITDNVHDLTSSVSGSSVTYSSSSFLVSLPSIADIKIGILHSLSGTLAISETTLKDTMLYLIDKQNAEGGINGEKLVPVVVDPASDWPLFAEKARELLTVQKVDVMFGCWTSVSRKSVLPVIEELNGLLFYPVQYEGEESS